MRADDFLPNAETVRAIERDIAIYNQRRILAHKETERRIVIVPGAVVFGLVLIAFLLYRVLPEPTWAIYFAVFGVVLCAHFWDRIMKFAREPDDHVQQNFRDHMLPVMFGFLKGLRYEHGSTPRSHMRMPRQWLPIHNHVTFDDVIRGRLNGTPFEIYEAIYDHRGKGGQGITFRGVVLACQLDKPFRGTLVVNRKVGQWLRAIRNLLSRDRLVEIVSGSQRLDTHYDFRTDNRAAARELLRGGFADALEWVQKRWPGDRIHALVNERELMVFLPSNREFFELPTTNVELEYRRHLEPMARDFAFLLGLVDRIASNLPPAVAPEPEPEAAPAPPAEPEEENEPRISLLDSLPPPEQPEKDEGGEARPG